MINRINLTVAGVHFSIGSDCGIVGDYPSDSYTDFISDAPLFADIDTPITLLAGAKKGLSKLERCFDASDMWSLFRAGDRRYIVHTGFGIDAPMWAAEFSLEMPAVRVHCGEVLLKEGEQGGTSISSPIRYPLDQLLLTYALARRQGFLLHTAGVLIGGKLWLLSGKSRAGKSTASALLKGRDGIDLLSDDRIVVRNIGGVCEGFGTPWPGEARIAENKHAPLAGILFLEQSLDNKITPIRGAEAFERLMPVVSVPWYEPELFPDVMDFCGQVAESLPMYCLQFRPDADAADMIENFLTAN